MEHQEGQGQTRYQETGLDAFRVMLVEEDGEGKSEKPYDDGGDARKNVEEEVEDPFRVLPHGQVDACRKPYGTSSPKAPPGKGAYDGWKG
jgi:hypothetical protein